MGVWEFYFISEISAFGRKDVRACLSCLVRPQPHSTVYSGKLVAIPLEIRNEIGLLSNIVLEALAGARQWDKRATNQKRSQIIPFFFFFADGMRVNIRGTPKMLKNKKFQQKGRIENQFTKSIAFLWTNKHAKKVVINTLLFTIECNEISWNKLNWGGQRPLQWKLQIPKGNDWGGHQKVENLLCSLINRINIVNSTESHNRQRHSSQKYKNAF